jgi:hypothetical protein
MTSLHLSNNSPALKSFNIRGGIKVIFGFVGICVKDSLVIPEVNRINKIGFESLLKNCFCIRGLVFNGCCIDKQVIDLINKYCLHLNEMRLIGCKYENVNYIINLRQVLGKALHKIELYSDICYLGQEIDFKSFLGYCPNTRQLEINEQLYSFQAIDTFID